MPEPTTEGAAWRAIGAKLEGRESLEFGLCWESLGMRKAGQTTDKTFFAMGKRVRDHRLAMGPTTWSTAGWAYEPTKNWEARCLAAYWMALEADADASGATGGEG